MMKRTGFTLVELLVVIAVIAILIAILFPVFAKARENARRSQCANNMKQVAMGMIQYRQDYDEKFPPTATIGPGIRGTQADLFMGGLVVWSDMLRSYLKEEMEVFKCPSIDPLPLMAAERNQEPPQFPISTVYNARLAGLSETRIRIPTQTGMLTDGGYTEPGTQTTRAVPNRSQRIVFGRQLWTRTFCGINNLFTEGEFPNNHITGTEGSCQRRGSFTDVRLRPSALSAAEIHNGGTNYVYADGHVKFRNYTERPKTCLDHNPPFDTLLLRSCPRRDPDEIEVARNVWTSPTDYRQ